jgi:hypothetical protein
MIKFRTTADLIYDEISQTRKDQRSAPWERFSAFELKLQDLEAKLSAWEEKIMDLEDRLVRLDEYCEELFALQGQFCPRHVLTVESEKEKYRCAVGTSILLGIVFAYDGFAMALPSLNFWVYLVLPHATVALCVAVYIWRHGLLQTSPTAYLFGFVMFLVLCMMHQHNFLQNQRDWAGSSSYAKINLRNHGILVRCYTAQGGSHND